MHRLGPPNAKTRKWVAAALVCLFAEAGNTARIGALIYTPKSSANAGMIGNTQARVSLKLIRCKVTQETPATGQCPWLWGSNQPESADRFCGAMRYGTAGGSAPSTWWTTSITKHQASSSDEPPCGKDNLSVGANNGMVALPKICWTAGQNILGKPCGREQRRGETGLIQLNEFSERATHDWGTATWRDDSTT